MSISHFMQDPDEKKDYGFDWSATLTTDTISTSVWVVQAGLTEDTPAPSNDTTTTTIWLSGGTAGTDYKVSNTITTAGGRIFEESFLIQVRDE